MLRAYGGFHVAWLTWSLCMYAWSSSEAGGQHGFCLPHLNMWYPRLAPAPAPVHGRRWRVEQKEWPSKRYSRAAATRKRVLHGPVFIVTTAARLANIAELGVC